MPDLCQAPTPRDRFALWLGHHSQTAKIRALSDALPPEVSDA